MVQIHSNVVAQKVKDLEDIQSDHGHNIEYLDTRVDDTLNGLDSLVHLVKELIDIKLRKPKNLVNSYY